MRNQNGPVAFSREGRTALDQDAANRDAKQAAIAAALARTLADGMERSVRVAYGPANGWGQCQATYYVKQSNRYDFLSVKHENDSALVAVVTRDAAGAVSCEER